MPLTHTARSRHIGGFTLIEIVITVLITVLISGIDLRFVRVGNTFRWVGGTPQLIVGTDKGDKRTLDIGAGGIALRLLNWREVPVVDWPEGCRRQCRCRFRIGGIHAADVAALERAF